MALLTDLPTPSLAGFTQAQLQFATAAWPMRAAEELRSALIYRALAAASDAVLPAVWSARFAVVAREEVGHARLCATIGAKVGAPRPHYDATPVRDRLARLVDPIERTLALMLAEVAIGETISMALFRAGRRTATEPLTRCALESILADEVRHQRLGWHGLATAWPLLDETHREFLQREATAALAGSETSIAVPVLRRLEAGDVFDPAWATLGVLPFETRVEAYYFAIERFVVPRLTRLGLDGERAWSTRYRGGVGISARA